MPRPIDHRDITLTNPNAETPTLTRVGFTGDDEGGIRRVDVEIDTWFDASSNYDSSVVRATIPTPPPILDNTGEVTHHEVIAKTSTGVEVGRIRWQRTASSSNPKSTWSQPRADIRDPASSGSPTAVSGNPDQSWTSPKARYALWDFKLDLWVSAATGYTVEVTSTTLSSGIRYRIKIKQQNTLVFSGDLQATEIEHVRSLAVTAPLSNDRAVISLFNPRTHQGRVDVGVSHGQQPAARVSTLRFARIDAAGSRIAVTQLELGDGERWIASATWRALAVSGDQESALAGAIDDADACDPPQIPARTPDVVWTAQKAPAVTFSATVEIWIDTADGISARRISRPASAEFPAEHVFQFRSEKALLAQLWLTLIEE